MEITIRKINMFRFLWRALNDLAGNRGTRNEIPLPAKIGRFELVRPILEDKKNNKFQYGIYGDASGKEYVAKQLSMIEPGIDEYSLRNEITAYSALTKLYEQKGTIITKAYPDIKIPKLVSTLDEDNRLLFLVEKINGKDLVGLPIKDAVIRMEKVLNYFKFLNTIHDFKNESVIKRNFVIMFATMTLATLGAIFKHPEEFREIAKGFLTILKNMPFLLTKNEKAFIHRDISCLNILTSEEGINHIIDFELSSYMHPLWEVVQLVVGSHRREGFIENFNRTETMRNIMANSNSVRLYKIFSIYSGIHILSTADRDEGRVISDKKYLHYALNI